MLAFKSDVSHWRQKKEMVGVSVRWEIYIFFMQLTSADLPFDRTVNLSMNFA